MVVFGATEITLPTFARDAVMFALAGRPFVVRDLPGQLDDAERSCWCDVCSGKGCWWRQDETPE